MSRRPVLRPQLFAAAIRRRNGLARISLAALLLLAICPCAAFAQYHFDSWTAENGLPQNSVWSIRQTRDGYLWLTTENGLIRFDGVRLTIFNNGVDAGIAGARFNALWETAEGELWASTVDGGVVRRRNGVFTSYTTKDGLPDNHVVRIDADEQGTIWFYHDRGLTQWKDNRMIRVAPAPGSPFNDHLAAPQSLGEYGRLFGLWRQEARGWSRFAYGQWSPLPLPPHLTDPAQLRVKWLYEDARRRLWYNLTDRPGEYYCVSEGRLTIFRGLPVDHRVCYQDSHGRLWLSDREGNAKLWKDGLVTPLPGLRALWNFSVLEDREGTTWIGTYDRGLNRLREQIVNVHVQPGGAEVNFVYTALQDRRGDVWVGSGFRGLTRLRNGRFEQFPLDGRPQTSELSALYEDADGSLWVGTFSAGILRLSNGELRTEKNLSAQIKGRIDAICRDRAGALWLGGRTGLYRYLDGRLTHYTAQDGLADDSVKVLHEDQAGTLWIGGYGGLSQRKDGKFAVQPGTDGASLGRVISLHEDAPGTLWIGTYDGGLYRLKDGAQGSKLTRYTTNDGLYDNGVDKILADEQGFFWISCGRGVYRVRKAELDEFAAGKISYITSTPYGKADGLLNVECVGGFQPAGFKASDGKLWFPTQEGVAVIDPRRVPFNSTPPPVVIEDCLLDRRPADFSQGLKIEPGQENLEINYTGLSFIKPEQMRFRYKLEELDRDWVDAGARRTAYYSYVPPGDYTFKVIAANSDGVWNTAGPSLRITVLPPFYRTWWFLVLATTVLAGLVYLAWQVRVAQLERAQAAQQAFSRQLIASQEVERKRISAELHDGLGQRLVVIKNLALMSLRPSAGNGGAGLERQRIEEISAEASHALGEVREISHNLRPYQLDQLGLTKAVEAVIKKAAAASPISITAEIDDIDGIFPPESEINFYRIVQESVSNLIKYSEATEASLTVKTSEAGILLTICDNGKGFLPGAVTKDGRRGFGLTGISERAQLLGGTSSIKSAPGQGTTISVTIELKSTGHA